MGVYKRGRVWWYRFTWRGQVFRESIKQSNKRVAEQMEAAHKTSLAKGDAAFVRYVLATLTVALRREPGDSAAEPRRDCACEPAAGVDE